MLRAICASVAVLGAASAASAAIFSNFEAPTYSNNAALNGQDGWVANNVNQVPGNKVYPDTASGYDSSYVLEGSQSVFMGPSNLLYRPFNAGAGTPLGDQTEISWLQSRDGSASGYLYFTQNRSSTPAGIGIGANGNFNVTVGPNQDTGVATVSRKIYRLTLEIDFSADFFEAFYQNLTDSGPKTSLGTYTLEGAGAIDPSNAYANGGLFIGDANSYSMLYDDIQVSAVPEPASAGLLAAMGLAVTFRRRRRRR